MKTSVHQISALSCAVLGAFVLAACGGDGDSPQPAQNGWRVEEGQPVTLRFAARAGNAPVACGGEAVVNGVAVEPADMRFYISGVRLLRADGTSVPLQLSGNNRWQYAAGENSVSLIDLRQPAGACAATSQRHPEISGTAAAGEYVGVEMVLGVPLAVNHLDAADDVNTPEVLRSSVHPAMSWNWRGGRKFTNIELRPTDGSAVSTLLHLGSTGCNADPAKGEYPITDCGAPNRVPLRFAAFNPAQQQIVLDVQALFDGQDMRAKNRCMSAARDESCIAPFSALGLDFHAEDGSGNGRPIDGVAQRALRVEQVAQ